MTERNLGPESIRQWKNELWPGLVTYDKVLSMGQIEVNRGITLVWN